MGGAWQRGAGRALPWAATSGLLAGRGVLDALLRRLDVKGSSNEAERLRAALAAQAALGDSAMLSRAALVRGKALAAPLMHRVWDSAAEDPHQEDFDESMDLFQLALRLDPSNGQEARGEIDKLHHAFETLPRSKPPPGLVTTGGRGAGGAPPNHPDPFDVIVVGAGAAGVGAALMLTRVFGLDPRRVLLLERGAAVGESFRRWPKEMRFISPSFNSQGWTGSFDLNSIAYGTSPAFTLQAEHPTGEQYAFYLSELASANRLNVRTRTEVKAVRAAKKGGFKRTD